MISWDSVHNIYLIGIKGGGMSALARLLKGKGFEVSGSDVEEKFFSDQLLADSGIQVFSPFAIDNIPREVDLVIYSTAYSKANNKELAYFLDKTNIPVLSYPEALGEVMSLYRTIAVSGTHGKTTTTALVSFILQQAGYDPSAIIGSSVPQFDGNVLLGQSSLFVVETDEYQNKFKYYQPDLLIVNNIDWDHPDFFADAKSYLDTFVNFIKKVPKGGLVVANFDDDNVRLAIKQSQTQAEVKWYSLKNREVDIFIENKGGDKDYQHFAVYHQGSFVQLGRSFIFGDFNLYNIAAAITLSLSLGVDFTQILSAISRFKGTLKRFESKGEVRGVKIFDDFAHHPSEIQATLQMAKSRFAGQKIVVVFQPHTYSRTEKLLDQFSKSFAQADQVIILDIFSSAREKQGVVDSYQLVEAINNFSHNALYLPTVREAAGWLQKNLQAGDVLITMGAGKADEVIDLLKDGQT